MCQEGTENMTYPVDTNEGVIECAQCAAKDPTLVTRRSILGTILGIASSSMGAILGASMLRYVLYPVYAKDTGKQWSHIGGVFCPRRMARGDFDAIGVCQPSCQWPVSSALRNLPSHGLLSWLAGQPGKVCLPVSWRAVRARRKSSCGSAASWLGQSAHAG